MQLTAPIRPLYQAQTYRNLLFLSAGIRSPHSCSAS